MASPKYTAGTAGNVIASVSVASGGSRTAAGVCDLTGAFAGAVECKLVTGGTAPSKPTTFGAYRAATQTAAAPAGTLGSAATSGASSITLASATISTPGQSIAIVGGGAGELATVQSASGPALTLAAALANGYPSGAAVYRVESVPSGGSVQPGNGAGSWSNNSAYATSLYPPAGNLWIVAATNADTAQAVTVQASLDSTTSIA